MQKEEVVHLYLLLQGKFIFLLNLNNNKLLKLPDLAVQLLPQFASCNASANENFQHVRKLKHLTMTEK